MYFVLWDKIMHESSCMCVLYVHIFKLWIGQPWVWLDFIIQWTLCCHQAAANRVWIWCTINQRYVSVKKDRFNVWSGVLDYYFLFCTSITSSCRASTMYSLLFSGGTSSYCFKWSFLGKHVKWHPLLMCRLMIITVIVFLRLNSALLRWDWSGRNKLNTLIHYGYVSMFE